VLLVGTVIRIPQLNDSLNEIHAFRQTQTAMVAREFARNGIDLLSSPLTVFGAHGDAPMEFPLFQAITALVIRVGVDPSMASRLVGLLSFQFAAIMLVVVVARLHGRRTALVALVLFEFLPFGLQWGAASLIEFLAVGLALGMVAGIERWLTRGSIVGLVLGSLSAILAFLVKSTTAPGWVILVLALCWLVVTRAPRTREAWLRIGLGLGLGPVLGLIAGLAWTVHADAVKTHEVLTAFLTSAALRDWNFGSLGQRLDPATWELVGTRISDTIAGPGLLFLGVGIVAIAVRARLTIRVEWAWVGVAVAPLLVFTNLYMQHDYYLSGIYPALVVIVALGIVALSRFLSRRRASAAAAAVALTLFLGVTTWISPMSINYYRVTGANPPESDLIDAHTKPDDWVIMAGCTWDPTILYFADRTGLSIEGPPRLSIWELENPARYSYLLLCSPDHAAQDYLPSGYEARLVDDRLYRVVETAS
jgi:multisubunit Na+/H+ antiporter MnhF subunit